MIVSKQELIAKNEADADEIRIRIKVMESRLLPEHAAALREYRLRLALIEEELAQLNQEAKHANET